MDKNNKETFTFEEDELSKVGWGRCFCGGCENLLFYFPPDVMLCIEDGTPFYCKDCAKGLMGSLN